MRRFALLALLAALLLPLGGCTLTVYNSYRDIESLEVVQAIGLDSSAGGVTLSAATGPDASGREPLRLTQYGESLDAAMRSMEQLAGGGTLFFSGTGAIVLGASAAAESARWLDALARSKELRLDTEMYVLRSGPAEDFVAGEDSPEDVFADLDALAKRCGEDGPAPVPTCADVSRSLIENGAALSQAIEKAEGPEGKYTAVPAGYCVLTPDGVAGWLDADAALGAGLLMGGPGTSVVELPGGVTAELAGAKVSVEAVWDGGSLTALEVSADIRGSVIEAQAGSDLDSEAAWETLESELAEKLLGCLRDALDASQALEADFLGLGRMVESAHPVKFAALGGGWESIFPGLEIRVSGGAEIVNMREYSRSPYEEAGR